MQQELDKAAILDVVVKERRARDEGMFSDMAAYYRPEAEIETSWFKGHSKDFVEQSEKLVLPGKDSGKKAALGFHQMGATVVNLNADRALAEADCTLHNFYLLEGVRTKYTGYVRLLYRLLRSNDRWLIEGIRCIYIRDTTVACNPSHIPVFDEAELSTYRESYSNLCYHMVRAGLQPRQDLPGWDLPETVSTVKKADLEWLSLCSG